jgi:membrane protease YdiL (CAAX protease family)
MANKRPGHWSPFVLAVVFEASLVLVAWGIGWAVGQSPWEKLTWRTKDLILGIAAAVPLLWALAACGRLPWRPIARIRQIWQEIFRPFFGAWSVAELAVFSVMAGVGEELLFRGLAQEALGRWLGLWPGILLASLLFGTAHLLTVTYGIIVTLVGIYLGWCYVASGNLLVVIVAHALYDFLALVYSMRWLSREPLPTGPGEPGALPGEPGALAPGGVDAPTPPGANAPGSPTDKPSPPEASD